MPSADHATDGRTAGQLREIELAIVVVVRQRDLTEDRHPSRPPRRAERCRTEDGHARTRIVP